MKGHVMTDLVDRHELRLALEREEAIAKRVLGKGHEPLATSFFEIVYRTLNRAPFAKGPYIICICGSMKFQEKMRWMASHLTLEGAIVVMPNVNAKQDTITPEQKIALDELHKRKIDISSAVFVVNVGGYIGDSTASEIAYALNNNKEVYYLEDITHD
jgi:hypothetical protein